MQSDTCLSVNHLIISIKDDVSHRSEYHQCVKFLFELEGVCGSKLVSISMHVKN